MDSIPFLPSRVLPSNALVVPSQLLLHASIERDSDRLRVIDEVILSVLARCPDVEKKIQLYGEEHDVQYTKVAALGRHHKRGGAAFGRATSFVVPFYWL